MGAEVTYRFQVPVGTSTSPATVASEAWRTAEGFFGHESFELGVSVEGRPGAWEVWATATAQVGVNGESLE